MARSRNARRRAARNNRQENSAVMNSLTGLAEGLALSQLVTGGSQLSSYGTVGWSNNYSLISLNQSILTYLYTGNGLFQTAIQLPIQDGFSKPPEIVTDEVEAGDIDELWDFWNSLDLWSVLTDAKTWARLYGGGGIVINTAESPEKPFNIKRLKPGVPIEFYAADRWELTHSGDDTFYFNGVQVHSSRVITLKGKTAPYRVRTQLSGWGMSEGERMIRDLNLYLKTQDVSYEILDEAKVDVYKIAGFAQKLATTQGTNLIQRRIEIANELKNYLNALVMDKEDDFDQKTLSFSGLAEVMNENRIGVASALRMPMVKLFGMSPAGFDTGSTDLDNYNQMVDGEIRTSSNHAIRQLLQIAMMMTWGFIPTFSLEWPPMKEVTGKEDEEIKTAQSSRLYQWVEGGVITPQEAAEQLEKWNHVDIDLSAARGILPPPRPVEEEVAPVVNSYSKKIKVYRNEKDREK